MDLSIVVVNWNTRDFLVKCLESIETNGFGVSSSHARDGGVESNSRITVETIVVDNASSDGSAETVRERFPWARLIASGENLGWAGGNNAGIRAAAGRTLLLLNPDTEIETGALETLVTFMDTHPQVGACAPMLLNPDGSLQRSLRSFPDPEPLFWDLVGFAKLFPRHPRFASYRMGAFDYNEVKEVDQPMGAALLIRRAAIEEVGAIDEVFPIFFNDVDWCFRAKQAGWSIAFVPDAHVVHHGGSSTRQVRPRMIVESHRAFERFYRKHYQERIPAPMMSLILALNRGVERLRLLRASRFKPKPLREKRLSP